MELTWCPQCDLAAEIVDRDDWPSTDGPVEHVHVRCVDGHRFVLPASMLATSAPMTREPAAPPAATRPRTAVVGWTRPRHS